MAKKLVRNKETGEVEVWEGKKKVGVIETMGDDVKKKKKG